MNRIQQILSKAERDGTARRLNTVDDRMTDSRMDDDSMYEGRAPLTGPREIPRLTVREPSRDVLQEPSHVEPPRPIEPPAIEPVHYTEPSTATSSIAPVLNPLLVAALDPLSPAAEHYRSLRSRIAQLERDQAARIIQVTSPGKGDGKTLTALNLALTMAQEFQRRVLAIDADFRHPRVHALLGLEPGPGLVDVLTGTASLSDALVELPAHHLTVLRAGRTYERPAEMLGSAPMRRLLDTLRAQFDRIVIDSAPAVVADPMAIAPIVDGLLLVVRAGVTTKPAIARALGSLSSSRLLGLVFNESGAPVDAPFSTSA